MSDLVKSKIILNIFLQYTFVLWAPPTIQNVAMSRDPVSSLATFGYRILWILGCRQMFSQAF